MKPVADNYVVESSTMITSLVQKSKIVPNEIAYRMLNPDFSSKALSFDELLQNVKLCAGQLSEAGIKHGDVCMLIFSQGLDFIVSFLACNWIGAIPVPLNKPSRKKSIEKWEKIAEDTAVKAVITDNSFLETLSGILKKSKELSNASFIGISNEFPSVSIPEYKPHEISFLQYTSGSTGNPKGVMVTQDSLYHNLKASKKRFEFNEESVMVSWLPFYHDMGLILGIFQGLFSGYTTVLMSPPDFMSQPLLWLKAISKYGGTHSAGPNFSLELVASRLEALKTEEEKKQVSLKSLKMIICGAEPVHIKTIQRFNKVAKNFDMNRGVVCPGYGLAEATLVVSSNNDGSNVKWLKLDKEQLQSNKIAIKDEGVINPLSNLVFEDEPSEIYFLSNGCVLENHNITVRDTNNTILTPFEIGELWFEGASVTKGYYKKEEATNEAYIKTSGDTVSFKTGDLGFLDQEGNIYVTGRIKDLIIIKGANHYPQDIERTAFTSASDLRTDGTAAFSVTKDNQEKLVIVQELTRAAVRNPQFQEWTEKMIANIIKNHEIIVDTILFVPPMHVPRTTSGKIQRRKARLMYQNNEWRTILFTYQRKEIANDYIAAVNSENSLREYTIKLFADQLGISETSIDVAYPFVEMGVNSMMSLYIRDSLDKVLSQPVQATDLFNYNTIDTLTKYLWNKENGAEEATEILSEEKQFDEVEENIDDLSEDELLSLLLDELKD